MENSVHNGSPAGKTVRELFALPFEPLTIQRKLKLFDKAIGLKPGNIGIPDADFLVRLLTKYRTHQAALEDAAKHESNNLENLLRGRGIARASTISDLAKQLHTSEEVLLSMVHGREEGPLSPDLQEIFLAIEGVFRRIYLVLTSAAIMCPSCGSNVLDDADVWWSRGSIVLRRAESRFAERLLSACFGGYVLDFYFSSVPQNESTKHLISELKDTGAHPLRHWLTLVGKSYGTEDKKFSSLENRLAIVGIVDERGQPYLARRLSDWANGRNLIPLDDGIALIQGRENFESLRRAFYFARTVALVEEFVWAAAIGPSAPNIAEVRRVIHSRLERLREKLLISLAHHKKRSIQAT